MRSRVRCQRAKDRRQATAANCANFSSGLLRHSLLPCLRPYGVRKDKVCNRLLYHAHCHAAKDAAGESIKSKDISHALNNRLTQSCCTLRPRNHAECFHGPEAQTNRHQRC